MEGGLDPWMDPHRYVYMHKIKGKMVKNQESNLPTSKILNLYTSPVLDKNVSISNQNFIIIIWYLLQLSFKCFSKFISEILNFVL